MIKEIYFNFKAAAKILAIAVSFILFLIPGIFTFKLHKKTHEKLIKIFFRATVKIFGLKIGEKGLEKMPKNGAMYVSNHTSYIDIIVIGSKLAVRFTPKIEISKWPVINFMVNMSLPVYIQRNASKSLEQKKTIRNIIHSGDSILLFPEGTTNDGNEVLPFKSSLFGVAEPIKDSDDLLVTDEGKISIQPISIVYTHIDGEEIKNTRDMDKIAWYGEMKFLPHFWNLLKCRGANVEIMYHSELHFEDFGDRKSLSKHCENIISRGVEEMKVPEEQESNNIN